MQLAGRPDLGQPNLFGGRFINQVAPRDVMQFAPTTHFVVFAQAVLYRAAWLDIVWPPLCALAGFTIVFFTISLSRFRTAIVSFQ